MTDPLAKAPGAKCSECPLKDRKPVFGHGPDKARVVLVGEAPGKDEVVRGVPFVGKSGQLINKVLEYHDIKREEVYVTNACLCRPQGNATPNAQAIAACNERLLAEVSSREPERVLAAGAVATKALLNTKEGITKLRAGGPKPAPNDDYYVIPTWHPAAALRDPDKFPSIVGDVGKVNRIQVTWEETKYKVMDDTHAAIEMLRKQVAHSKNLVLDVENDHHASDYIEPDWLCIGVSHRPGGAVVYDERVCKDPAFQQELRKFLEDPDISWGFHNGQYDIKTLWSFAPRARVDEDTILMHYCHAPGTKILKRDLTWENVEELRPDDELVAFDEVSPYLMKPGKVLSTRRLTAPCYEVVTDERKMVVTGDHKWLTSRAGDSHRTWRTTKEMAESRRGRFSLTLFAEPWETLDDYDAGYIAGILDGEGCLYKTSRWGGGYTHTMTFAQKPGPVLDKARAILEKYGIETYIGQNRSSGVQVVKFNGSRASLRAVGMFRPTRFMWNTDALWEGPRKGTPTPIREINYIGEQEVVAVETDTHTLIADGFMSHNCTDERKGTHDLEQVGTEILGAPSWKSETQKYLKNENSSKRDLPTDVLHKYNAMDTDLTHRLIEPLRELMRKDDVESPYYQLLIPGSNALARAEYFGVRVDADYLTELEEHFANSLESKEAALKAIHDVNPRSPQQLKALFEALGCPVENTTKDTLKELAKAEPSTKKFIDALLAYKKDHKLESTYVRGMRRRARRGRIHPTFKAYGTETGRLSSSEPNVQNIPRPDDDPSIPNIRNIFIADPGCTFVSADYSNIEYRIAAVLSGDPWLLEQFRSGTSLHKAMAAAIFGEGYTDGEYTRAKVLNFTVLYEGGAGRVSGDLGISYKEAEKMIEQWHGQARRIRPWQAGIKREVQDNGYLTSYFGRKRRFWLITKDNWYHVAKEGLNFPVQSPASDLTLTALIRLVPALQGIADPVITVHDSLTFQCKVEDVPQVVHTMREVMEDTPFAEHVPTPVDFSVGPKWGSGEKMALANA